MKTKDAMMAAGLAAGLFLTGCATAGADEAISEEAAATLAKYDRTGEIERCISLSRISSIRALDPKHLLVRVGAGDYYLNQPSGKCSHAHFPGYRLQYTVSTGQLCRGEIVNVVDNSSGMTAGACSLGDFEELVKKAPEPEEE